MRLKVVPCRTCSMIEVLRCEFEYSLSQARWLSSLQVVQDGCDLPPCFPFCQHCSYRVRFPEQHFPSVVSSAISRPGVRKSGTISSGFVAGRKTFPRPGWQQMAQSRLTVGCGRSPLECCPGGTSVSRQVSCAFEEKAVAGVVRRDFSSPWRGRTAASTRRRHP